MNGITLLLHRYSVVNVNAHGNDVGGYDTEIISGCAFAPGQTAEATQGADQVTTQAQAFLPPGIVVTALDRIEYPPGVMYEVTGDPEFFLSPFTGNTGPVPVRVRLQEVTGVTAHSVAKAGSGG